MRLPHWNLYCFILRFGLLFGSSAFLALIVHLIDTASGRIMPRTDVLNSPEKVAHDVANEALSISIGIQMLSTIPKDALTPEQTRALAFIEASAERLVSHVETLQTLTAI